MADAGDRDADGDAPDGADAPGVPLTPRARARSAALWGLTGGVAFLALAQGYRLVAAASLPVGLVGLVAVAVAVAAASAGIAYFAEVRLRTKRRT